MEGVRAVTRMRFATGHESLGLRLGRVCAAVAIVAALAVACGSPPPARALGAHTDIAFQANTGELWTWKLLGGAGGDRGWG